jgi:hypothetical protein
MILDIQTDLKYFKVESLNSNFFLRYDVAKQLSKNSLVSIKHYARSARADFYDAKRQLRSFDFYSLRCCSQLSNDAARRILLRSSNRTCVRYRSRVNILLQVATPRVYDPYVPTGF